MDGALGRLRGDVPYCLWFNGLVQSRRSHLRACYSKKPSWHKARSLIRPHAIGEGQLFARGKPTAIKSTRVQI